MMKTLYSRSFGRRYYYLLISAVILFFFVYTWISTTHTLNLYEAELDKHAGELSRRYMERIRTVDKLYYMLEKQIDAQMRMALETVSNEYRRTASLDLDYDAILNGSPHMELYVIDQNNRIIRSTDPDELGIDFTQYGHLNRIFAGIRNGTEYVSDRINTAILTQELKKFSYHPSHDHRYLFKAGYSMNRFENFLGHDALTKLTTDTHHDNPAIEDMTIFNSNGQSYDGKTDLSILSDRRRYTYNRSALAQKKVLSFTMTEGAVKTTYLYHPYVLKGNTELFLDIGLETVYSNRHILTDIQNKIARESAILLVFVALLLASNCLFNRTYLFPLERVIDVIRGIHNSNFSRRVEIIPKNEIGILADNINIMITNISSLLDEKEQTNRQLKSALEQNERGYFEIARALANSIDIKDSYTGGHCERVMEMSLLIADEYELTDKELQDIRYGSLLHDIGKIGVKDRILNKPGTFTPDEYEQIKLHPRFGFEIVREIEFLDNASGMILSHHERIDGRGYPNGISGDDIPFAARIVSIADAFDAMTSKRIYREKQMTVEEAFDEMYRNCDTQFDGSLVAVFVSAYTGRFGGNIARYASAIESP